MKRADPTQFSSINDTGEISLLRLTNRHRRHRRAASRFAAPEHTGRSIQCNGLMPEDLESAVTAEQMADLIAFLLRAQ
jgi:hypothetical protein